MKKKYLNTLLALVILAGLWGWFTYYDKHKSTDVAKTATTTTEKILTLDTNHIQSFTIKPRGGDAFTCRRQGSNWEITEPKKVPADQSAIRSFLDTLTTTTVDQVVDPHPASLKDFGLDPPAQIIEIQSDAKPEKSALLLGDDTPTSSGLYAQVSGNPRLVTVASYAKTSLEKTLFDLRDKRAVTLDPDHLQRVEVSSKGKRWTLEKNPEGVWDVNLPPPVRTDHFTVDGILNQLRNANMVKIVAEDKKRSGQYGFGSPTLTAKFIGQGGSQTLVVGKKDGDNYDAMNSAFDPLFTVSSSLVTELQKDAADLRDKELFTFVSSDVKRVEVDAPKGHRVFEQQKDKKWKQTAPNAKDVAGDKMGTFLSRLRDLRANTFPKGENLAALGLTNPAYKFQVQFGDKNQKEAVEAGKVGDHIYARRSTDPLPSEVSKTSLDDVEKALGEL